MTGTCLKCGCCCFFKVAVPGGYRLGRPCPYLTPANTCEVYPVRHLVSWCQSIQVSIRERTAPAGCAYAPKGYRSLLREDGGASGGSGRVTGRSGDVERATGHPGDEKQKSVAK